MEISRDRVVAVLRERGYHDRAAQAELELPETIDTDKQHDELTRFGVTAVDPPKGKKKPTLLPPHQHGVPLGPLPDPGKPKKA
jgi:hypothetical protein